MLELLTTRSCGFRGRRSRERFDPPRFPHPTWGVQGRIGRVSAAPVRDSTRTTPASGVSHGASDEVSAFRAKPLQGRVSVPLTRLVWHLLTGCWFIRSWQDTLDQHRAPWGFDWCRLDRRHSTFAWREPQRTMLTTARYEVRHSSPATIHEKATSANWETNTRPEPQKTLAYSCTPVRSAPAKTLPSLLPKPFRGCVL